MRLTMFIPVAQRGIPLRCESRTSRVRADRAIWALGGLVMTGVVLADQNAVEFDLDEQDLSKSLLQVAMEGGVEIIFVPESIEKYVAPAVRGTFSPDEVIALLLSSSGMTARRTEHGVLVIEPKPPRARDELQEGVDTAEPTRERRSVLGAVAAFFAGAVRGTDEAQELQPAEAQTIEEIQVTGSRIRDRSGFTMPVPVTSITKNELFDMGPDGTLAERLGILPQFHGSGDARQGGDPLFGSAGASFLNIRSLGRQRTLVLLDGSRVAPTDKRGGPNVDAFPSALMRNVEVVTGGASAAYGADGVGGAVNFVLNREFEGLSMSFNMGAHEATMDGLESWSADIVAGGSFLGSRLRVVGALESSSRDEITADPKRLRNYQRWGHVTNPVWSPGADVPQRLTLPNVVYSDVSYTGLIFGTGTELDGMRFTEDGTDITPFIMGNVVSRSGAGSTLTMSGGPESWVADEFYGGGPSGNESVQRSAFLSLQYQIGDNVRVFGEGLLARTESNSVIPRGDANFHTLLWAPSVAVDNAYLPERVREIMIANGLEEIRISKARGGFLDRPEIGHGNTNRGRFDSEHFRVGMEWMAPNGWTVDFNYTRGRSKRLGAKFDEVRVDRQFLALDAVRHPETGAIVCRVQLYKPTEEQLANHPVVQGRVSSRSDPTATSVAEGLIPLRSPIGLDDTIRDCTPYNVMGTGNVSKEALAYTSTPKFGTSVVEQDFAEILATGEIHQGWGSGAVAIAAGVTWRDARFRDNAGPEDVDELGPPLNAPDLGIRGIPPNFTGGSPNLHAFSTIPVLAGQADVWEAFGEVNLPIWESSPGGQRVVVDLAARHSNYGRSGGIDSWKVGANIRLHEDLRLRFTGSSDVREPTFAELFDAQGGGASVEDPRFLGQAFAITQVSGGNPALAPEKADTLVAGFVYEPSLLPGVQLSVDWWDVRIADAVGQLGAQTIVNGCEIHELSELCSLIDRDPVSGEIGRVFNYYLNVDKETARGTDLELLLRGNPNLFAGRLETFNVRALAGYVHRRAHTPRGGAPDDRAGSRGGPPKLQMLVTATYGVGAFSFQLQSRHVSSVTLNRDWEEGVDVDINRVASQTTFNGRVSFGDQLSNGSAWRVGLNVQNLFNREPPIIPSFNRRLGSAQTVDASTYDAWGRRYSVNMRYAY